MEDVGFDNQAQDVTDTATADSSSVDTTAALDNASAQDLTQDLNNEEKTPEQKPYVPFASGKEKFKVNGSEEEWDWETTRKYAQIGKAGYSKMEKAAQIEKKATETYKQILDLASRDPEGLIRMFNPNFTGFNQARTQDAQAPNLEQSEQIDPRDSRIAQLEQQLERINKTFEEKEIAAERQAIAQEISEAETKYPILKGDQYLISFIKSEYRRLLQSGVEATIEDVAFHVAQDAKAKQEKRALDLQKRHEQKVQQSPVSPKPSGGSGQSRGMTREDVMRLAGKIQ